MAFFGLTAGLVNEQRGVAKDRKWAERYINPSRPVQYDEDGHAHYLDEDEVDPVDNDPDALVDPDQFFEGDRGRRFRKLKQRTDNASEEFYPSASAPSPMDSPAVVPPRGSKSLAARTKRFFGMHGGSSSAADTYPEHMNRHSRINSAMGDMELMGSRRFYNDAQDDGSEIPSSHAWPNSSDASNYDDLDRELMGLSTQENYPPVRGSRRQPKTGSPSMSQSRLSSAPPPEWEPQRDVLEFEHTF
ncbi:hypothetical protein MCAP1_002236 [Malassezia caprae]|uniref:Uncharacterized protein n=1 Tax=Malassezia caprae TaxID=1381934 RepID=A0AAF0E5K0_9BASI|nr:hypothetical protein MCAP1_002236 [Malassezia caprae]